MAHRSSTASARHPAGIVLGQGPGLADRVNFFLESGLMDLGHRTQDVAYGGTQAPLAGGALELQRDNGHSASAAVGGDPIPPSRPRSFSRCEHAVRVTSVALSGVPTRGCPGSRLLTPRGRCGRSRS